jgi:hypothetical protein
MPRVVVPIVLGALGSFAWSFVLAAVVLRMKHWRNGVLVARGAPPYKDCVFPRAFWFIATLLGVATIIPISLFVSCSTGAVALSALGPPTTLALVPILAILSQARR